MRAPRGCEIFIYGGFQSSTARTTCFRRPCWGGKPRVDILQLYLPPSPVPLSAGSPRCAVFGGWLYRRRPGAGRRACVSVCVSVRSVSACEWGAARSMRCVGRRAAGGAAPPRQPRRQPPSPAPLLPPVPPLGAAVAAAEL